MTNILKYQGIRKDGTSAGGAVDGNDNTPAWLAQQLYNKGWRQVTITRDGEQVGGIGRVYNGPRDWWGECVTSLMPEGSSFMPVAQTQIVFCGASPDAARRTSPIPKETLSVTDDSARRRAAHAPIPPAAKATGPLGAILMAQDTQETSESEILFTKTADVLAAADALRNTLADWANRVSVEIGFALKLASAAQILLDTLENADITLRCLETPFPLRTFTNNTTK